MEAIKKEIETFLATCLRERDEFITKLKEVTSELNSLKYQAVSKYHITSEGVDTFTRRVKNTFLAKVDTLDKFYQSKLNELQVDYTEMMREHQQLNQDWKVKKTWDAFKAEYDALIHEVIQEKAEFRQKLEQQCAEINKEAENLLSRFQQLFANTTDQELKVRELFLTYLLQETPDSVMTTIMSADIDDH